jgi:hypothetical protein
MADVEQGRRMEDLKQTHVSTSGNIKEKKNYQDEERFG